MAICLLFIILIVSTKQMLVPLRQVNAMHYWQKHCSCDYSDGAQMKHINE